MSTALVNPFGGAVALNNPQAMAEAAKTSAMKGARGAAPDGSDYLNFSGKRGVYEFGTAKEGVSSDELWLVNIGSFEDGYVCWKGGSPVATRLANIYSGHIIPVPDQDEYGPFNTRNGEGWFSAKSMIIKSLDEDDRQGYFKINSKSGVSVFADLQSEVADRLATGRPAWPVIRLEVEKFVAQGNTNYKPKLVVDGWLGEAALAALVNDPTSDLETLYAMEDGSAAAPAIEQPTTDEPAVTPAPATASGGRRRRATL